MATIDDDTRALFEGPNYVHLTTLLSDGSPHTAAVWSCIEDGKFCFFTQAASLKARNVERDPRVSMSLVDHDNPYKTARVRGRVVEIRDGDEALEVMDRMARKYTGNDFPLRSGRLFLIEPDQVTFGELPFVHAPG
jgi:PPOX class probable F420-dependent enzyme